MQHTKSYRKIFSEIKTSLNNIKGNIGNFSEKNQKIIYEVIFNRSKNIDYKEICRILKNFIIFLLFFLLFSFNFLVELIDNELLYSDKDIGYFVFKTNLDYKDISERNVDVNNY